MGSIGEHMGTEGGTRRKEGGDWGVSLGSYVGSMGEHMGSIGEHMGSKGGTCRVHRRIYGAHRGEYVGSMERTYGDP